MAKDYKDLVVGLDIGTAKIMVVVAEVMPDGELKLAGFGVATRFRMPDPLPFPPPSPSPISVAGVVNCGYGAFDMIHTPLGTKWLRTRH